MALLCSALLISSVIPAVSFNADAAAVQSSTIPITAKITAKVNLQKSADKTAAAVKVLPKNTNITILEVVNAEWYYVKTAGGALGYCSSEFVDITTDAKSLTATKIYSDSSVKDTVIKTAAPGMTLDITAFLDNNWAKVLLEDGTSGYVECSDIAYVSGKIQSSAAVRQISETAASDITLFENSVTVMAGSTKKLVARYASGTVCSLRATRSTPTCRCRVHATCRSPHLAATSRSGPRLFGRRARRSISRGFRPRPLSARTTPHGRGSAMSCVSTGQAS